MKLYRTVFIFAYYSYKDPVFQSAVLPYFIGLHKLEPRLRFVLLTFEQKQFKLTKAESKKIRTELEAQHIFWYQTKWHSGKFKIVKKIYDIFQTLFISTFIILKYKVNTIYSEGFPGAVMGHWLAKLFGKKHIVHTFEPHTQYMVESGVWHKNSWEAKLLSKYELIVARRADVILTATNAMIEKLKALKIKAQLIRVPSCVDTDLFNFSMESRKKIRNELKIKEDEIVIAYLGKFGGMYMDEEIFDFFKVCEGYNSLNFKYFIFTNEEAIEHKIYKSGIERGEFLVKYLNKSEISTYLSASDFGLVAVRQYPSKKYCSPIKNGEYWACGLPIIIPKGISDDYIVAKEKNIGIVLDDLSAKSYVEACGQMKEYLKRDKIEFTSNCRNFVLADRDVALIKKDYINLFID